MGAFDDLIPAQPVAAVGAFDDLIPKQAAAPAVNQSPFADLVPQSSSPSSLGNPLSDADLDSLSQPVTAESTGPQDVSGFVKQASPSALSPSVVSQESAAPAVGDPMAPLVTLPKPANTGVISGTVRGVEGLAEGLTSPVNIALMGLLPGAPAVVQKLAAAGFTAQMAHDLPSKIGDIANAKTPGEAAEKATEALGEAAMVGFGGKHAFGREGAGVRPISFSPEEADHAAVQNQLRSLTPPQTPLTKEAQPILPDVADSLVLAREKLTQGFNSLPAETQRARQASIDDIDNQLLQVSRDDVQAAEARVAARGQSPPSEAAGDPPVAPGGPSGNLGTSSLFRQAKAEAGIPEEAPPESTPEPPAEATAIDPDMAKAAQDTAERIADQVTQGQPSAVRDAARDAAMDNAMSSMKAGKSPSAAFMRASAKEAAGKASATQGVSLDVENEQGTTAGEQQASGEATPVQDAAKADTVQAVQDTVAQLPENLRRTAQAFLENPDKSLRELADDLGVSHQTVANHLKAMQEHFQALKDEGMSLGPGAASAVEKINETLNPTGLKRVTVDTERLARGAEPIPSEARQSEDAVVRAAEDQAHADPTAAPALVSRIVDQGDRAISEKDAASLLVERQRIMNERAQWEDRLGRGEDVDEAKTQLTNLEGQLDRLDRAQRAAGTTWGRLGHMYQRMIKDDFTLESMERKARAAKEGPLTEEERGKLKEQADKIAELQNQVDEKQTGVTNAAQDAEAHRMVEATINELGKNYLKSPNYSPKVFEIARRVVDKWKTDAEGARDRIKKALGGESGGVGGVGGGPGGRKLGQVDVQSSVIADIAKVLRAEIGEFGLSKAEALTKLASEFGEKVRPHFEKAWAQANQLINSEKADGTVKAALKEGITKAGEKTEAQAKASAKADAVAGEPLSHKTAYEMVRALIQSGVHGTDALMKAAHEGLKEAYTDLTERDVRRAFSEYGKVKFPSKEALNVELAETRRITQLQESIDRLNEGKDALHTGLQREKATQQVREKTKELNELLKKREGPPSPEKLASRDEAKQTALKNQIADIDKELRTGEKPVKGQPAPDSVRTEQLKAERDAMKAKLQEIEEAANPGLSPEERANQSAIRSTQKSIAELDRRLREGEIQNAAKPQKSVSPELEQLRSQRDAMRAHLKELQDAAKPVKDDATKQIEQLTKVRDRLSDVLSGKRPENAPKDFNPLSAAAEDIKAEIQAMNELKAQMKRDAKPPGDPGAQAEKAKIKALEKAIKDYEDKTKAADFSSKGKTYGPDSKQVADLKAIRDARREAYKAAGYNERKTAAITKRTAELEAKIKAGDFTRPAPRVDPKLTDETFNAQAKLARAQNEFNRGVEKQRLANRTPSQKFWDHFVGIERAMKLSSDVVLGKLSTAALLREAILTPAEEIVGSGIKRLIPDLAARAPRQGRGFNVDAEIKAKTAAFTSGMKDAWENLKMKQSNLDELYGKEKNASPSWYDYFGFLHGALKAPVKRAEFARSLEHLMQSAKENGENTNDVQVMGRLSQEAYLEANRAIFMQDNVVSDTIKNALNMAEKSKKSPNLGPALARIGRFLLPIVKVPTNIVGEVATGVHGAATGGFRTAKAYYDGIQTLPPEQADSIMRQLKKGLVGNALLLTGYFGYKAIGGFYQPRDQRADSDVQPDHYRVGKVNLPGFVGHSTAAMLLNIGATLHREQLQKGFPSAVSGTAGGVVKQLPFVPAVTNAVEALQSDEGMKKYLQNLLIGSTVPAGVAHAAKVADTPGTFPSNAFTPANKRSPSTLGEGFKAVIPGLRPQVPSDRQSSRPVGSRRR